MARLPARLSVLLVDDSEKVRAMQRRLLRSIAPDWSFTEAPTGEAALALLEQGRAFDVVGPCARWCTESADEGVWACYACDEGAPPVPASPPL